MKKNTFKLLLIALFSISFTSCEPGGVLPSDSTSQPGEPTSASSTPSVVESAQTSEAESIKPSVVESETSSTEDVSVDSSEPVAEWVDYVAQTKLDLNDPDKIYARVSVRQYVDGDTTHFTLIDSPYPWIKDDYLKARYNSVDTKESTGKVEKWGKYASNFTKTKLLESQSIIIQSDTNQWLTDSTGERYLVWVWYQPKDSNDYRLLNLELVQEGLAGLKSASSYSLFETFYAANLQAMNKPLRIYDPDEVDPYWYYGEAQNLTLKELRLNAEQYKDTKVCVEGLVTVYDPFNHMAYAESYDAETNKWYGMNFYAGFTKFKPLATGNYLRLVGTLSWYSPDIDNPDYGTWQVTGLNYLPMTPDYEGSMKILEKNVTITEKVVTAADLANTKANPEDTLTIGETIESTYVTINNLNVKKVYTTSSTNVNSNGALTLTCTDDQNREVIVRTSVLKKSDGTLLTEEDTLNKTISAKGIVTKYNGKIQIHVFTLEELTIL